MTVGELMGQVLRVNADMGQGRNITNIVLMGTGEPLLNYKNVVAFLRRIHGEESLNIAMRNISLSTCGIVPGIDALAEEGLPITLCLSLHSAIAEKRRILMPVEEKYPLPMVIEAMKRYNKKTGRRIIYEYILIGGVNMGREDVSALVTLLAGQNCHLNLIPLNPAAGGGLKAPGKSQIYEFAARLEQEGISVTVRRTLGQDIEGACGQLRARFARTLWE
jgi:23S rRNA (adenine2503-C2)-methyltransferase